MYYFLEKKMFYRSHLDQKYDQEVEVSDSAELLKQVLGNEVPGGVLWVGVTRYITNHTREWKKNTERDAQLAEICHPKKRHGHSWDYMVVGTQNMKQKEWHDDNAVAPPTHGLWLAHLGGDNAVVRVTLRDVGLDSRRGFFMSDVHRPTVHPDLLPHTLMETIYGYK